ncbi:hypothetical protein [Teichococcus aestuarii]
MASHSTASSESASESGEAAASARSEAQIWVEGEGSSFAYSSATVSIGGSPAGEGVHQQAEAHAGFLPEGGGTGTLPEIPPGISPEIAPEDPHDPFLHALPAEELPGSGLPPPPFAQEFGFA